MSAFSVFKTDEKAEQEGVWQDFGTFKIRLARTGGGNKRFQKMMEARMKPYNRAIALGTMEEGVALNILADVYSQTVITGWQCLRDGKWEDVVETAEGHFEPYDHTTAKKALLALPNLLLDLQAQASSLAMYRDTIRGEEGKN